MHVIEQSDKVFNGLSYITLRGCDKCLEAVIFVAHGTLSVKDFTFFKGEWFTKNAVEESYHVVVNFLLAML